MSYTPVNGQAFTAAYSGAVAGMAVSGWITDNVAADYATVCAIAGAFAQAFDTAWNSATVLNLLQVQAMTTVAQQEFASRAPGPLSQASYQLAATWTVPAQACVALINASSAYFAGQGIIPPPAPPSTLGAATQIPFVNDAATDFSYSASLTFNHTTGFLSASNFIANGTIQTPRINATGQTFSPGDTLILSPTPNANDTLVVTFFGPNTAVILNAGDVTTGAGNAFEFRAGNTSAPGQTGGQMFLQGGDPGSGGKRGGVVISIGNNPGTSTTFEAAEVAVGRRVAGLVGGSILTTAKMPANTGDLVCYIGNANTLPTVDAVAGGILYNNNGFLSWRATAGGISVDGGTGGILSINRPSGGVGVIAMNDVTSGAGNSIAIRPGNTTVDGQEGGVIFLQSGDSSGVNGLRGRIFLSMAGFTARATRILECAELIAGQRVLALSKVASLTTSNMPANTGDLVIFIGNAAAVPTANPVGGGILYVEAGALKYRGTGGTITTLGAA